MAPRTVYSTGPGGPSGGGRGCSRCGAEPCRCGEPRESVPPARQRLHLRIERGGRGGKTVTVIAPLRLVRADAEALLAALRKACGSGGTLRLAPAPDGSPAFALELQGDLRDRAARALAGRGFAVPGTLPGS